MKKPYNVALVELVKKQRDDRAASLARFYEARKAIDKRIEECRRFHDAQDTYEFWSLREKYRKPLGRAALACFEDPGAFHRAAIKRAR